MTIHRFARITRSLMLTAAFTSMTAAVPIALAAVCQIPPGTWHCTCYADGSSICTSA